MKKKPASWFQADRAEAVQSELSGRTLWRNTAAEAFYLPADVDVAAVRAIGEIWARQIEGEMGELAGTDRSRRWSLSLWDALARAGTRSDVVAALDRLIWRASAGQGWIAQERVIALLTRLWAQGLLAWPKDPPFRAGRSFDPDPQTLGPQASWIRTVVIDANPSIKPYYQRQAAHALMVPARCVLGIVDAGDLTPTTLGVDQFHPDFQLCHYDALRLTQQHCWPHQHASIERLWRRRRQKALRKGDPEFGWVAQQHPDLNVWRSAMVEWVATFPTKRPRVIFGDSFLRYLVENPAITRDPKLYCALEYRCPTPFSESSSVKDRVAGATPNNYAHDFLAWLINQHLTQVSDNGQRSIIKGYGNPIARIAKTWEKAETDREPMPRRLIQELILILGENDYAWARTLEADYFNRVNPETGKVERVWSPVRVIAILLKLLLPLRTAQVCRLESSEGDSYRYLDRHWVRNALPTAPKDGQAIRRGVLRQFKGQRGKGTSITGFFINTNKTQKRSLGAPEKGYTIPWQYEKAIDAIQFLELFQTQQNPVSAGLPWNALKQPAIELNHADQTDAAYFLMRDPCSQSYKNEPVTPDRLHEMWVALLSHLEQRLKDKNIVDPVGEPYELFEERVGTKGKNKGKTHRLPIYDLHTTRVTILTALAKDGGVPIDMLSKCVAGHTSLRMTLYYIKHSAAEISASLTEASERLDAAQTKAFHRNLRAVAQDAGHPEALVPGPTGLLALRASNPASWDVSDIGVCPVAKSRCHDGGPPLDKGKGHAPVLGGALHCPGCRFFITGPAFLMGLVARFNNTSVAVSERAVGYQNARLLVKRLQEECYRCQQTGVAFDAHEELRSAINTFEERCEQLDVLCHDLHHTYGLIERCRDVLRAERKDRGKKKHGSKTTKAMNLVLAGAQSDLDAALEMTSKFSLLQWVCERANIHPMSEVATATMRRSQIIDRWLERIGDRPRFASLEDEEARLVANEFVAVMNTHLDPKRLDAMVSGRQPLLDRDRDALRQAVVASEQRKHALSSRQGISALVLTQDLAA